MSFRVVAKKEEERFYLDRFAELVDNFPQGEIVETENPDFLVVSDRRIGVEVTKLYWEPEPGQLPAQATAAARNRVVRVAQAMHSESEVPNCHVSIHFSDDKIRGKDANKLAKSAFDVVANNLPQRNEMRRIPPNMWTEFYMPDGLDSLLIYRDDGMPQSFYGSGECDFVPDLDPERDIQQRVLDGKNGRVDAYLQKCDEVWLVINIGFGELAGEFDISDIVSEHEYQLRFSRAYVLHQNAKRCIRLRAAA